LAARHKSAVKRHRSSLRKRDRNKTVKSSAKTAVKKVREALDSKKLDDAKAALKEAMKVLQSAASKGVIHKRNAARRISRIATRLSELTKAVK
jgi:small subunit ribosomal protein S20